MQTKFLAGLLVALALVYVLAGGYPAFARCSRGSYDPTTDFPPTVDDIENARDGTNPDTRYWLPDHHDWTHQNPVTPGTVTECSNYNPPHSDPPKPPRGLTSNVPNERQLLAK